MPDRSGGRTVPNRRKRRRVSVETLEYLAAARRFIRAAGRRVAESDEHELEALLHLSNDLAEAIQTAVDGQRAHGKSWADIARATGKTSQAAHKRWGRELATTNHSKDA
jgi:DNA-directed RNA polymerase specialized sigma24 family protein